MDQQVFTHEPEAPSTPTRDSEGPNRVRLRSLMMSDSDTDSDHDPLEADVARSQQLDR
jgi:hypothetical protein